MFVRNILLSILSTFFLISFCKAQGNECSIEHRFNSLQSTETIEALETRGREALEKAGHSSASFKFEVSETLQVFMGSEELTCRLIKGAEMNWAGIILLEPGEIGPENDQVECRKNTELREAEDKCDRCGCC